MKDEQAREKVNNPAEEQMQEMTADEQLQVETVGAVIEEDGKRKGPDCWRIDLHCHSEASPDCSTPLELIPPRCGERGINVQAITDHNTIDGALRLQEILEKKRDLFPFLRIIVGEEISSTDGEIIGLYLKERVEAGLSPEETVERIRAQGGLVLLPHGFDPLKRWRLQPSALERIADEVQIVETFNARISRPRWNQAAVEWAKERGLIMSAGSDAHTLADIGAARVEVPFKPFNNPESLLLAMKEGIPVGDWTHPLPAFLYKTWDRLLRRMKVLTR